MKITALLVAGLMTLGTLPVQAHHRHDDNPVPAIVTGAILGGLIYYGSGNYHHHHHHNNHRRNRPGRVIDTYRHHGNTYHVCRRGNKVFYC